MKITKPVIKTILLSVSLIVSQQSLAQAVPDCTVPECQPLGHIGPMELSNTDLRNGAKGYRGWFENGSWQGDLIEYDVSSGGGISTSIDLTGASPAQSVGGSNWSAHVRFAETADSSSHWNDGIDGRKIIFSNNYGSNQKPFRWEELKVYQKEALDNLTAVDAVNNPSAVLNYLRGDRSNEGAGKPMRTRFSVLGDIIHSNPEYVGAPEGVYTDPAYVLFKNTLATRSPRVYVGANDGMLHAFNANTGQEEWAYVPSMLIPKMASLSGVPYAHTYFVDGAITVQDAVLGGDWRTVLVGSLGAGGRGLYALDVTNPSLGTETANGGGNKKILWEERAENAPGDPAVGANPDIGYIFDATTIAQLNDGKWYAVFGNGIGSDNGDAVLMMKPLRRDYGDSTVIKVRTGTTFNGLSAPALVDTDNDGTADIAWAGDIKGDLWRFDLSGTSWTTAYKVYDGDPSQPITTAPEVTSHPQTGHIVLFGTGKLYEEADLYTENPQALYGIWDKGTGQTVISTDLLSQELSFNTAYTRFGFNEKVRTFTTTVAVDYATYLGWSVELFAGERMLTPPQLRAGRLKATVYNPNDNTNWLFEATFLDGNMASNSIYNLNQDTKLDEKDRVNANENLDDNGAPDYTDPEDIPMSWKRPDGNMSQPTIASLGAGVDTMFLNFLDPPLVQTAIVPGGGGCTGDCAGGLEGGHIDLDYDIQLGGDTDDHDHEYDDDVNSTNIDYLDLQVQTDITALPDANLPKNQNFIPLIANADFSKGATLIISRNGSTDDIRYNVVEYQKMLHEALAEWDGISDLTTPASDGSKSLLFKVNQIDEFKISFNSLALISGGLHPSVTGCVQGSDYPESGRWRNGALTMQLVDASHFSGLGATESALDRLVVQTPVDFQEAVYLTGGVGVALTKDVNGDGVINALSTDYEIYGGLLAKDNDEFFYESTMFWHFNGACYGEPTWAEDYLRESQYSALAILYEQLDRAGVTTLDELAIKIDGLLASGCATVGASDSGDKDTKDAEPVVDPVVDPDAIVSCQAEYDQLQETYALGLLLEANGGTITCDADGCIGDGSTGDGTGTGSGTSNATEPLTVIGGIDESGITSGPNFTSGRRTWIDILTE